MGLLPRRAMRRRLLSICVRESLRRTVPACTSAAPILRMPTVRYVYVNVNIAHPRGAHRTPAMK